MIIIKKTIRDFILIAQAALLCGMAGCAQQTENVSRFEGTVESLQKYECPEWFRDAKFGIYLHWGAYSVAEQGEWYARNLYLEKRPEYKHHVKTYGHPSKFGYKDFIPLWKAENFDPDALLALFKRSGARYFSPCAVHHDNFDLWNSKHHRWNAAKMGPKRDLIKLWREATLKAGLRFGVTTHLSRSYSWLNVANGADTEGQFKGIPYDGAGKEGQGLYPPAHGDTHPRAPLDAPGDWRNHWARRVKDLIDNYSPDLLYFDCAVPFRGEDHGRTGLDVISHHYNQSIERNNGKLDAVMCIKERPWQGLYADGIATLDFERGKASHILPAPWQTDDSIGAWGYDRDAPYTTTNAVVDKLIDIVSKNGCLLLNIPILADGTLDATATTLLEQLGEWMDINGEGIYGTRPWYMHGEGPTHGTPHKTIESPYTRRDIRYTTKEGNLYVFILDWPGSKKPVVLPNLTVMNKRIRPVRSVTLLGHNDNLKWEPHPDGLTVSFPAKKPCDFAYTLKITFEPH